MKFLPFWFILFKELIYVLLLCPLSIKFHLQVLPLILVLLLLAWNVCTASCLRGLDPFLGELMHHLVASALDLGHTPMRTGDQGSSCCFLLSGLFLNPEKDWFFSLEKSHYRYKIANPIRFLMLIICISKNCFHSSD